MKVKKNLNKKVSVSDISFMQLCEMFEGGNEDNIEGLDEFDTEDGDAGDELDAEMEDDMEDDMDMEDEAEGGDITVTLTAEQVDVLRAILDQVDGGADAEMEDELEDDTEDDVEDDMEGDMDDDTEEDENEEDFFGADEDEESPATVANGAPKKTVGTPEWQGKNKMTVDSELNPGKQMTQF